MPAWLADDDPDAPAPLRDRNGPTEGSVAGRQPTRLVRQLRHSGAVASVPSLDPNGLPGCRHQFPELAEKLGLRHRSAVVADRSLRYANASWASADRTAQPSAG